MGRSADHGRATGGSRRRSPDEERFTQIYPDLRRFAAVVADSDVDPDDLVQEAIVQVLRRGRLDDVADLRAYLRRSIVNLSSNERRHRGRRRNAVRRLQPVEAGETQAYPSDTADLDRLPALDRAILHLSLVEGRQAREVGDLVGLSPNAVHIRLSRSRRVLRRAMEDEQRSGHRTGRRTP